MDPVKRMISAKHPTLFVAAFLALLPVIGFAQGAGGGGGGGGGAGGGSHGVEVESKDPLHDPISLMFAGVVIAAGIGTTVYRSRTRRKIVSVNLVLRRGQRYGYAFDDVVNGSRFSTPAQRREALKALIDCLKAIDVAQFRVIEAVDTTLAGADAEMHSLWQSQMKHTRIKPKVLNVSSAGGGDAKFNRLPEREPVPGDDPSVCFLGIILAAAANVLVPKVDPNGQTKPIRWQDILTACYNDDTFYFYYTPKSPRDDTPLSLDEALKMLESVKALG